LSKSFQKVVKNCQNLSKVVKKVVKKLSKSCKKLQKVVKKLTKSCQKSCQKVSQNCQKVSLVILCVMGSHLQNSTKVVGCGGGEIVVQRPSASASLTGQRQKYLSQEGIRIILNNKEFSLVVLCGMERKLLR
jgi:hypothetical protein